ncbi:MAG: hypothetical protein R2780_08625 [Crocinitomicaceae bacterium]
MKNLLAFSLLMLMLMINVAAKSQDNSNIYSTANGVIQITAVINDSSVVAQGRELHVVLNYDNAALTMQLDFSTLKTGSAQLDSILARNAGEFIVFSGSLGLDYIQTGDHPPQNFEVKGTLSCDPSGQLVEGKGLLEHIYNGWYSSIFEMSFYINLNDIGITPPIEGMSENIQIEISEAILNQAMD